MYRGHGKVEGARDLASEKRLSSATPGLLSSSITPGGSIHPELCEQLMTAKALSVDRGDTGVHGDSELNDLFCMSLS